MEFKILDEESVQYQAEECSMYSKSLNEFKDECELTEHLENAVTLGAYYAEKEFYKILQKIKKDHTLLDRILAKLP